MSCKFLRDTECTLMKKISGGSTIDCWVTSKDCSKCRSFDPPAMVNRFTVCTTLNKLNAQSKFSIVQHYELVHTAQCTLGTGTMLHGYLKWFRSAECGCEHKVDLMNTWGPKECKVQKPVIMKWLEEASILMQLQFVYSAMEALLNHCIYESEKLHKEFNLEWLYNV